MKAISLRQAKDSDLYAIHKIGIPRLALMENAGRAVAEETIKVVGKAAKIAVLAGPGYNGGDGLVAARHLYLRKMKVEVYFLSEIRKAKDETVLHLRILEALGIAICYWDGNLEFLKKALPGYELIIDAIFGVGLKGEIKEPFRELIKFINGLNCKILSVDIPSGLDADCGKILGNAVRADYTVTFVAPKEGMLTPEGRNFSGEVIVAEIGSPLHFDL